jgi:hypothetical protein
MMLSSPMSIWAFSAPIAGDRSFAPVEQDMVARGIDDADFQNCLAQLGPRSQLGLHGLDLGIRLQELQSSFDIMDVERLVGRALEAGSQIGRAAATNAEYSDLGEAPLDDLDSEHASSEILVGKQCTRIDESSLDIMTRQCESQPFERLTVEISTFVGRGNRFELGRRAAHDPHGGAPRRK